MPWPMPADAVANEVANAVTNAVANGVANAMAPPMLVTNWAPASWKRLWLWLLFVVVATTVDGGKTGRQTTGMG